jgi:hypothetical protein
MSHVTRQTSHVKCHTPHVKCHAPNATQLCVNGAPWGRSHSLRVRLQNEGHAARPHPKAQIYRNQGRHLQQHVAAFRPLWIERSRRKNVATQAVSRGPGTLAQRCRIAPVSTLHITTSPSVVSQMARIRSLIRLITPKPSPPSPHAVHCLTSPLPPSASPLPPSASPLPPSATQSSSCAAGRAGGSGRLCTLVQSPAMYTLPPPCPSAEPCRTGSSFRTGKGHCPKGYDCAVAKFEMETEPLRLPVTTEGLLPLRGKEEVVVVEEEDETESGRRDSAQMLSS